MTQELICSAKSMYDFQTVVNRALAKGAKVVPGTLEMGVCENFPSMSKYAVVVDHPDTLPGEQQ